MSHWTSVLRALPTTFVIYASSAIVAVLQAWPTSLEFSRVRLFPLGPNTQGIATIETWIAMLPVLRAQATAVLLAALVYAVLSPWLQMAWLSALAEPRGPLLALSEGLCLAPRACFASLWVSLGVLLMLVPWLGLAWTVHGLLATGSEVRVHDLATALSLTPCLPVLLVALTWHDLARGRCLTSSAFRSVTSSLRDAFRMQYWLRFLAWASLGAAPALGAQAYAFSLGATTGPKLLLAVALVQASALSRSVFRSRWLAEVLQATDPLSSPETRRN